MRRPPFASLRPLSVLLLLGLAQPSKAIEAAGQNTAVVAGPAQTLVRDLYLAVSVNGAPTGLVAALKETAGVLAMEAEELRSVGLLPAEAARTEDGRIRLDRLPGVTYRYDEIGQSIDFDAPDGAREAGIVDIEGSRSVLDASIEPAPVAQANFGALLNYSLFAATPDETASRFMTLDGVSGSFEARMFSPYGVFAQTFVAGTDLSGEAGASGFQATRLDSSWSLSDPDAMLTYRAGDLITGGLDWTRPARLGGLQMRRNFSLRSDLVTLPIPGISGSAAVPSTVDVYLNGTRRFSRDIAAGPFALVHLPVVTGAGTARVVVRDAAGRETVSESSFFSSAKLLAPGLADYSAEVGFGRADFGAVSDAYDSRPMASGSLRYGLTPWLTGEAHAEGGADVLNGGLGVAVAVASRGMVELSAAGSQTPDGNTGMQLGAAAEFDVGGVLLRGRTQRTLGDYEDIASIIDAAERDDEDALIQLAIKPPKAIDQVSVSLPLIFDPSEINLSFTRLTTAEDEERSVFGLSYGRAVTKAATVSVSAFADLRGDAFGIHAGLSVALGNDYTSQVSASGGDDGAVGGVTLSRRDGGEVGDYGWQIRDSEGERSRRSVYGDYRADFAEFGGGLAQSGDRFRATAHMDGAVIAAGGGVFASGPVDDAFAVVDVGVPGVTVEQDNRPVGRTGGNGKLLLTKLRAFEKNRISIDPSQLPLDTTLASTNEIVVPADRSGVVVSFDAGTPGASALVTFRDAAGGYVPLGAIGRVGADGAPFVIGYDGQAYVDGLTPANHATIEWEGGACTADFSFATGGGDQVAIPDATCRAG